MATETETVKKAIKLIEALAEPCESDRLKDHEWRKCRHCLAVAELGYGHGGKAREVLAALLAELKLVRGEEWP